VISQIIHARTHCGAKGCLAVIYPAKGKDVKSPVDNLQGGGQLYYIETIYHPTTKMIYVVYNCILRRYDVLCAGVLCSDELDPACYIETV